MSPLEKAKKIQKIRTFADDYEDAKKTSKSEKIVSTPITSKDAVYTAVPIIEMPVTQTQPAVTKPPTKVGPTPIKKKAPTTPQVEIRKYTDANDSPLLDDREALSTLVDNVEKDLQAGTGKISEGTTEFRDDDFADGTIIRETKKRKYSLIQSIIDSVKNWFTKRKEEKQAVEAAKPRIINPKVRAEKLREASQHSALPVTAETLVRPKGQQKITTSSNISVSKREVKAPAAWTYLEDDAEGVVAETIDESSKADNTVKSFDTVTNESRNEESKNISLEPPVDTSLTTKETSATPNAFSTKTDFEATSSFVSTPMYETAEVETNEEKETSPELTPISRKAGNGSMQQRRYAQTPALPDRRYYFLVFVVIAAIIAGVLIALLIVKFFISDEIVPAQKPEIINTLYAEDILLSTILLQDVDGAANSAAGASTRFITMKKGEGGARILASGEEILSTIGVRAQPSFVRSIRTVVFGEIDEQRFIIMRTNDFDRAFAGMLDWEQTMIADLDPFFSNVSGTSFTDMVFNNLDLRIADSSDFFYTFVTNNTILIATEKSVIEKLEGMIN